MAAWLKINEGGWDRISRAVFGGVMVLLFVFQSGAGGWYWAIGIIGLLLFLTGLIGFCPLYRIFGVNTCSARRK